MASQDIAEGMKEYLYNDGMADYITMIEGLGLVGQIAGLIVGILVTLIIVGLPIVIAIELCYINFPTLQSGCNNLYERLKGKPNQILGLVLRDAMLAVKLSHTSEYGKSANGIYLRLKVKAIFISLFLVALTLGPGQVLIQQAWVLL